MNPLRIRLYSCHWRTTTLRPYHSIASSFNSRTLPLTSRVPLSTTSQIEQPKRGTRLLSKLHPTETNTRPTVFSPNRAKSPSTLTLWKKPSLNRNSSSSSTSQHPAKMLTVHHLGHSQSERIVWLCEELGIPYELKKHQRSPVLSPPEYTELHPLGSAPVIQDTINPSTTITLAESAACVEYIIHIHGGGRLAVSPGAENYADYLYWFHFVNGTLQPGLSRARGLQGAGVAEDNPQRQFVDGKARKALTLLDTRLAKTGAWLAGEEFTAADIMIGFTLTGMREFIPLDLDEYPNIVSYLQRIGARESYRRAMKKGDPDIDVDSLLKAKAPKPFEGLSK